MTVSLRGPAGAQGDKYPSLSPLSILPGCPWARPPSQSIRSMQSYGQPLGAQSRGAGREQ